MEGEIPSKQSGSAADTDSVSADDTTSTAPAFSASTSASATPSTSGIDSDQDGDDDDGHEAYSSSVASSNVRSTHPPPTSEPSQTIPPAPARTPSSTAAQDQPSLNSASDNLVLFDLTTKRGAKTTISPHTIKTILGLKLLGVGYDRQRLTLVQIRGELAERVAENVTVPALELADGTHIMESWAIAEYLERNHPRGHLLFGSSASKRLAALLNDFGKAILVPSLGPLTMPGVHRLLDEESADYFANQKVGPARWNKISNLTQSEKEAHIANVVKNLEMVETMLCAEGAGAAGQGSRRSNGLVGDFGAMGVRQKRSKWVAGGEEPSHADFVLFGWYVYSRAAGATVVREIWGAHRAIKTWVDDMLAWCEDIKDDFVPI